MSEETCKRLPNNAFCPAVYRDEAGALWARPEGEFADGRFEPLPKVEEQ